ncbi:MULTISPECIES: hypothetical protein [Streptomyces]|uniref:Uncharacterized protein n=1 Tax=Streptomyces viridochromogenes TaxID=1938 RepID=A0A0L8K5S2_STRVR|nr:MULTISPECIES: hypothetical protein [Streptomyces]KOG21271.1 hypothetical protein ADK34_22720 [Streptomyces viridochromogenes]
MSRTLFVLRYRGGEPEPLDMQLVREVLEPYVVTAGADLADGVLIRTADGFEVDVDVNEVCVSVSRYPAGQFFDVLATLVDRLGATVLSSDRPVVIRSERDRAELSEDIREGAVVVATTAPALEGHFTGS